MDSSWSGYTDRVGQTCTMLGELSLTSLRQDSETIADQLAGVDKSTTTCTELGDAADRDNIDRGQVSADQSTGSLTDGPACTVSSTVPNKVKVKGNTDIGVGYLGDRGSYLDSGTWSSRRQGTEEQWETLLSRMSSLAVNGGEDVGSGLSGELAGMTLTDRQHGGDRQETAMETDMPVDDGRGEYGDRLAVRMTGLTLTDSPGRTVKTGRRGVTANLATLRTDAWSFWQQKDRHGSGGGERTKRKRDNPVQICKDNKGVGRDGVRQKDSPDWQKRSLAIQRTKLTRTLSPAKLLGAKKLADTKRGQSGRQDYFNTITNPNAPSGLVSNLKKKFQGGKDKDKATYVFELKLDWLFIR